MRELEIELFTNISDAQLDASEWDRAVLELGGPIYMSYDWVRLWWQFYGRNRQLRIFRGTAGERTVAIVPFYIEEIGRAPFKVRIAKVVGASIPPRVFDPPVHPEYAAPVFQKITEQLLGSDLCDLISFGPISSGYNGRESLSRLNDTQPDLVGRCDIRVRDVRTIYNLPPTFESYFSCLAAKERKVRRKKLRELEEEHPIRSETVQDPDSVVQEFEEFARQHTLQWQAEGRPGHFHAWPEALEFHRSLVSTMGRLGRVRFYKLTAEGVTLTNQYAYSFGETLFAELPSRAFGPEWNKFSLGGTSQIKLIEAAITSGFTRIDSGLGHYPYKILTGGIESPVEIVHVLPKRFISRLRVSALRSLMSLYRVLVQKLWYRRIMPLLPARVRGGQSIGLVRSDF